VPTPRPSRTQIPVFRRPADGGLFALLPSDDVPDHLRGPLALLRFSLRTLFQGAALSLNDLQQERFPFAQ
jgi:hypothetical protein